MSFVAAQTIDIQPTVFSLQLAGPVLQLGKAVPFQLAVSVHTWGSKLLAARDWPHFQFALYVSEDESLEKEEDYKIWYRLTECQRETLRQEMKNGDQLILNDPGN